MPWCLTKDRAEDFKKALVSGAVSPVKLSAMTSEIRREFLVGYVGKENAKQVNALFESKLLLKNQQRGIITWAKRVAGISSVTRRDIISRVERMESILNPVGDDPFLQDLASSRLRINVTQAEAKQISELSSNIQKTRDTWQAEIDKNPSWSEDSVATRKEWLNNPESIKFGQAKVDMENYLNDLKLQSRRIFFKEQKVEKIKSLVGGIPGTFKSLMSSLDDSFWGRQGVKALWDFKTSKVWVRNFAKSFKDIGRELKNGDALDLVRVDIYSRPNALNGKYDVGKYGLSVLSEEAFPSSIPEMIPGFGRLFKASNSAYSGGALRMRADLADIFIRDADRQGINTLDRKEAQKIGHLVGSMTGRGSLGSAEVLSGKLNYILWSAKFFKSNIDVVLAPAKFVGQKVGVLRKPETKGAEFASREAAKNTLRMTGTLAFVLSMAKLLDPDSVDEDPRSTNFGKIKMFGKWIDITGGMASIVRLAARIMPTKRNGVWGQWSKSSTGKWTNLQEGGFGAKDSWDLLIDSVISNKLSPIGGTIRDRLRGEMFGGEPFNLVKSIINNTTPLSIQTFNDVKDEKYSDVLGLMSFELAGFSPSTYEYKASWEKSTSKEMKQFKEEVGAEKFERANDDYNRAYNMWFDAVRETDHYKNLSDDGKSDLVTKARKAIKDRIFEEYGFKYEKEEPTEAEEREKEKIKDLLPQ